ncbi:MAG: glycosyltransferase [Steroidobacteraceae bacterium]
MRLVIDLQGAQTDSHKRGIGRYSLALALALARRRGGHEVVLALNGRFPDRIEPIRASFDGLVPQDQIRIFDVPGPVRADDPHNKGRQRKAELIREAFLASLDPDAVLLTSLFEGYVDDAVTSIGRFAQGSWLTATVLYDLIPLAVPENVFVNATHKAWYLEKIEDLRRADMFLAISDHSRLEGIERLNLNKARVANISTAVEGRFRPLDFSASVRAACLATCGITRHFVFYAGGFEARKNVERAVRAFALLPVELRNQYQFVLAGELVEADKNRLQEIAVRAGLETDVCVFTGQIGDDILIKLYNFCTAFIFPSSREGFGLPVLEAMACGAPTIAAHASSIPEVVGLEEALFDPESETDTVRLLGKTLADEAFRARLRDHGLARAQKFSWDETARRALDAIERGMTDRKSIPVMRPNRPRRLAFVSPLPPTRSGIADYSAELLPALAQHYEIVLIVDQEKVDTGTIGVEFSIRDAAWLRANAGTIDRVVYQMGNSQFHDYMRELMIEVPGTVVLHDFFLGGLYSWVEHAAVSRVWTRALYRSHGYVAVRARYRDVETATTDFPVNLDIVEMAQGVIVHSEYARMLASQWLGRGSAATWTVIPHLRQLTTQYPRRTARQMLGLPQEAFIICSFGFVDPVKLSHQLAEAFVASFLVRDPKCLLLFVGENHDGDYGAKLLEIIRSNGLADRIRITGWADSAHFRQYLAAADLAIQLRTGSRGETSGTVLDCLAAGVPLIVNAHGSVAELPADAVWMLDDEFSNADLINALETLYINADKCDALSHKARDIIATRHAPDDCAKQYAEAIEASYAAARTDLPALLDAIAVSPPRPDEAGCRALAQAIALSLPTKRPARQFLLDVSATCRSELKTGIERVARALTVAFLEKPPEGFRIEPVYLNDDGGEWRYRYARRFTLYLLGCPPEALTDDVVELQAGDVLLGLDNSGHRLIEAEAAGLFDDYRNRGVAVYFTVHDLLPLRFPQYFPPGSDKDYEKWLRAVLKMDGALCVSRTVAADLHDWAFACDPARGQPFHIGWFHHGADIEQATPTLGLPKNALQDLVAFASRPGFLMVGTIEPRKGHMQVLDAFDQLWRQGLDINLIIAGAEGWRDLRQGMRRTIPQIVARLRSHPERGRRLFWVNGPSDEYLEKIYAASSCLIAAAEGEGFGLPLIEGARHKLSIIARDIPVFREVAGEHAFYFAGERPEALAQAVKEWLTLYHKGKHPKSDAMPRMTWAQTVERLKAILFGGDWYASIPAKNAGIAGGQQGEEREEPIGDERELEVRV